MALMGETRWDVQRLEKGIVSKNNSETIFLSNPDCLDEKRFEDEGELTEFLRRAGFMKAFYPLQSSHNRRLEFYVLGL